MELLKKKIGILGAARSGIAAANKIKELGGEPFLSECKSENEIANSVQLLKKFNCEFGGHTKRLLQSDIIIVSPGIPLDIPILLEAKARKIELLNEIELGYLLKNPSSKIIAVTGSNGKSTTVSLIHHILQEAGYNSVLAGNIGTAFTSYPIEDQSIDFIVLELSSFQLELIEKFNPDVAVLLNIRPDHLNRYPNMITYAKTKFRIFKNQTQKDLAILNSDDLYINKLKSNIKSQIRYFSLTNEENISFQNNSIQYSKENISLENSKLKGPHNLANLMASILAVSQYKIDYKIIEHSLNTFQPLPHRMEFVDIIDDVTFINDSKATNTDAVKYALQSFKEPVRLIIGGAGKGEDYSILNPHIKKHVKKLYIIGEDREKMKKTFQKFADLELFLDFGKAIKTSFTEAKIDDVVILSPACASFDMFKNFEERGNRFKEIVGELS